MKNSKITLFLSLLSLLMFSLLARATAKAVHNEPVAKPYYIVGLVYYQDAQASKASGYQAQIETALATHGIRTIHTIEVVGKMEMHGKKDFIKTPQLMKVYQATSKAKYRALMKDKKFRKLLAKGKEAFSEYLIFSGKHVNDAITTMKETDKKDKIFSAAFIYLQPNGEADFTDFRNKLKPLTKKYGMGSAHSIRHMKKTAWIGQNNYEIPYEINVFYIDTKNKNGAIRGYLNDPTYKALNPVRIKSTKIWGMLQGKLIK